jgi:hypothetical protein
VRLPLQGRVVLCAQRARHVFRHDDTYFCLNSFSPHTSRRRIRVSSSLCTPAPLQHTACSRGPLDQAAVVVATDAGITEQHPTSCPPVDNLSGTICDITCSSTCPPPESSSNGELEAVDAFCRPPVRGPHLCILRDRRRLPVVVLRQLRGQGAGSGVAARRAKLSLVWEADPSWHTVGADPSWRPQVPPFVCHGCGDYCCETDAQCQAKCDAAAYCMKYPGECARGDCAVWGSAACGWCLACSTCAAHAPAVRCCAHASSVSLQASRPRSGATRTTATPRSQRFNLSLPAVDNVCRRCERTEPPASRCSELCLCD